MSTPPDWLSAQPYRLDGRHALVTGGASGIGEATVKELARAGAFVWIPVHGVGVGVVGMQANAVPSVARELDEGCFICGIGAAHDFGDLLVILIEAARDPSA